MMKYGYIVALLLSFGVTANAGEISDVRFGANIEGSTEIQFVGNDIENITTFNMNSSQAIVIDFLGASSSLSQNNISLNSPYIRDIVVLEGTNKTRATIYLNENIQHVVSAGRDIVTVSLSSGQKVGAIQKSKKAESADVSFSRGKDGQGILKIVATDKASVSLDRSGKSVTARLNGVSIPKSQVRRMNVTSFGTPVQYIDVYTKSINIKSHQDDFEISSYQNGSEIIVEFGKKFQEENIHEKETVFSAKKDYSGQPMSLNFQQIDVRAVLQLIADYTNTNIVVSDEVQGNITLRLNEKPSDLILETILKARGLSKREVDGIMYIAPTNTLLTQETTEMEGLKKKDELSPLITDNIIINYARAENIAKIIRDASRNVAGNEEGRGTNEAGFLSSRGSLSVDPRTNSIIIRDVASNITEVKNQIAKLDKAVAQVLISGRIVTASDSFKHELGVRLGGSLIAKNGKNGAIGVTGSGSGASSMVSSALDNVRTTGQPFPANPPGLSQRLGVNLGASGPTGTIGIGVLGADYLIDLELSAMNEEGRGEIISNQRIMTQDGAKATISQGTAWPYQKRDKDGMITVAFKDVTMTIDVTPKITPNKMVDLEIDMNKDTVARMVSTPDGNIPAINTNTISTQVLVESGETVVLGGSYEQSRTKTEAKVPVLGDLPAVGRLFRKDANTTAKDELLVFVTPQIIDNRYVSSDKFSSIRESN